MVSIPEVLLLWVRDGTVGSVVSPGMEPGQRGTEDGGGTLPLLPVHGERICAVTSQAFLFLSHS